METEQWICCARIPEQWIALAKTNTQELVRNRGALAKYSAIKSKSFSDPPGIPDSSEDAMRIRACKKNKKLASVSEHGGKSRITCKNF